MVAAPVSRHNSVRRNSRCCTIPLLMIIAAFVVYAVVAIVFNDNSYATYTNSLLTDSFSSTTARGVMLQSTAVTLPDQQRYDPLINPLAIPPGQAQNLPSERVKNSEIDTKRTIYGGVGDKKHLGGFTEIDLQGVSPAVWRTMLQELGVKSVLDVGCGRGISTVWFAMHGCRVQCVEGSHDAVEKSIVAAAVPNSVVEHDFSRGPWWPGETFDAVWAVEFLEHVGVNYHFNYVSAFRKAALLFVTSSRWGGWHHVEVHADEWWIRKYESYGFKYDQALTQMIRQVASKEQKEKQETAPNGENYNAQHIWLSMKVFVNPVVAALPQHAHLFPQHGCFDSKKAKTPEIVTKPCEGELVSPLPKEFWPLVPTKQQDEAWSNLIKQYINVPASQKN